MVAKKISPEGILLTHDEAEYLVQLLQGYIHSNTLVDTIDVSFYDEETAQEVLNDMQLSESIIKKISEKQEGLE